MTTREQVLDALVTRLQTITTANGYTLNIGLVKRSIRMHLLYENAYPAIQIEDGSTETIEYKTGGLADIYFTAKLSVWVRSRTSMSESMNAVDLAIKKAIATEATLGGLVAHATIQGEVDKDLTGDDDIAKFIRPIRIFYEGQYTEGM